MRLVFFGTPEFAVPSLAALAGSHDVLAAVTMPDRPAGRKLRPAPSPVKKAAAGLGIPCMEPPALRKNPALFAELAALGADAFAVAAYGFIFPKKLLAMTRFGALNVHASLLPKYRGASPIHAALLAGDRRTGITIMQMDEGLDTGPALLQKSIEIGTDDFRGLHDRLAALGAECLLEALEMLGSGGALPVPQDGAAASYAPVIRKSDGRIDWAEPTARILGKIKAYGAWPGAYAMHGGAPLKIISARAAEDGRGLGGAPGAVVSGSGLVVRTGDGALEILEVLPGGGKKMPAADFLRGRGTLASLS